MTEDNQRQDARMSPRMRGYASARDGERFSLKGYSASESINYMRGRMAYRSESRGNTPGIGMVADMFLGGIFRRMFRG